jgi:hypothetical protein
MKPVHFPSGERGFRSLQRTLAEVVADIGT